MNAQWKKLGQIYHVLEGRHEKLISHASNPLPVLIKDDVYRVFYSGRDVKNRSSVGAVDINILTGEIIKDYFDPFFCHGHQHSFYADGVSIGNTFNVNKKCYMLFMGWQNPLGEHWRGDIGCLEVKSDLTLELRDEEPFFAMDEEDPISLSYPWVMADNKGGFDMWYGSTLSWAEDNGEMLHIIKHASSTNGELWHKQGASIPYQLGVAQAFSRPTVVRNSDLSLDMWFSYRSGSGQTYRIGHAHCTASGQWELMLSTPDIDVSESGWDSEMIEYPFVLDHKGKRYMFYNGNSYGKGGFGLAVLEDLDLIK